MQRRTVAQLIIVAIVLFQSAGELVNTPRDTESKVGDTIYFNCSTNLTDQEIFWNHGLNYIYIGNEILHPYNGRFEIDRNASKGSHNLVILAVQPSDAGEYMYICIDDDGHGTRQSAELVVLDNDPDCQSNIQPDGVIGQNIFNIPLDEVQLTCNVTYHGNIPPQLEWKKVGGNSIIVDNVTSNTTFNRVISILKLKGDISMDKSSYLCQTKTSAQHQHKCTSETLKILHFSGGNTTLHNVFIGEKITCPTSNNTFPCSTQWNHDNFTRACPLSCDETIATHFLGEYLCTLKCTVRGTDYSFKALKVVVTEATTPPPPSTPGVIAASIVVPIIAIIVAVLIAVFVVRYTLRKNKENSQRNLKVEMEFASIIENYRHKKSLQERPLDKVAEEELELLHKIKKEALLEEEAIRGVAILRGHLFIVRTRKPQLEVYDCSNFNLDYKLINVSGLVDAFDIVACKVNTCLYIMDKKVVPHDSIDKHNPNNKKVIKISVDGKCLKKWKTKKDSFGTLSATKEGNVIITIQDKHMLLEYSSDGNLMRTILLKHCIRPWHAIKLDDDQYVVSHGTYDNLNRVCVVDKKGVVKKEFGHDLGSAAHQLHIPYYLAVGSNGCVLVADLCNNRVLLLDSNLDFKTKIVPRYRQGFQKPRRIYLDEGRLVVVIGAGIPRQRIIVEKCKSRKEIELVDILTGNDYPKETNHEIAHDFKIETETATLEVCDEQKTGLLAEVNEQPEDEDLLKEIDMWLRRKTKDVDISNRIVDDVRLMVFDIQPLLQKCTTVY